MADDEVQRMLMREIKIGRFIVIDGVPCKVVDIETSSPGKHGSAKMRVTAIGIFDGQKKTILKPSDGGAEVPIIKKPRAQVVSVQGPTVQLMDETTYEIFELPIPEELMGKIKEGAMVELLEAMGRKILSRVVTNE